jgi:hypothetical protein
MHDWVEFYSLVSEGFPLLYPAAARKMGKKKKSRAVKFTRFRRAWHEWKKRQKVLHFSLGRGSVRKD